MYINLYSVPLLIGFIIAWIGASLILLRALNNSRYSDILFSSLLITTSLVLLEYMFGYMGINILWEELLFFPYGTNLLIGPLFYFYFKAQIDTEFRICGKLWLHFLPYSFYVIYHLIVFMQGRDYVLSFLDDFATFIYIDLIASFISNIFYFLITLRLYQKYRTWLSNEMPEGSSFSFKWFKIVLISVFISILVMWSFTLINLLGFSLDYEQNVWQYILLSVVLVILSFEGYAQKQPLYLNYKPNEHVISESRTARSSNDFSVNELESEIKLKILELVEDRKLYLNPNISLTGFASESGFSKSDISQCINTSFNRNFSQFINEYRVDEVCNSLKNGDQKRLSLLGIAMNAGFNSKATFNRVFKEYKKMTPLEYANKFS